MKVKVKVKMKIMVQVYFLLTLWAEDWRWLRLLKLGLGEDFPVRAGRPGVSTGAAEPNIKV